MNQEISKSFLVAAIAGMAYLPGCLFAQTGDYPKKQAVRIVAGVAPGGGTDTIAREVANQLTGRLGGSFIVENRTGASGAIAMQYVAKAPPDGYTLYVVSNSVMATATMLKFVDFDTRKAFAPIIHMDTQPCLLTVPASVPVNSLKELVAYARANPGKLNFGFTGYTSPSFTGMIDFQSLAGAKLVAVPYKGASPSVIDTIAGRLQILMGSTGSVGTHVKAGKLKALAIATTRRSKGFPDVPTAAEAGMPDLEAVSTHSLFATGGTPRPIIGMLNKEVNQIIQNPEMIAKMATDGAEAEPPNSPEDLAARLERDTAKWTKFYKDNPEVLQLGL